MRTNSTREEEDVTTAEEFKARLLTRAIEWPPALEEAHARTLALVKDLVSRFGVTEQVAVNEILITLCGLGTEIGLREKLTVLPLKAVVNLFGFPEADTPHRFFEGEGLLDGKCAYCKGPRGGPLHDAVKLPKGWLEP